jgi:hypothetical protein
MTKLLRLTAFVIFLISFLESSSCQAPPFPPPILSFNYSNTLSDSAVLQRNVNASIFGFGPIFAHFSISLINNNNTVTSITQGIIGSDATWRVTLPKQSASGPWIILGNLTPGMWVPSNSTMGWILNDIYFGDVFICGGQSNMAFGLGETSNATADIAASINYFNIRIVNSAFSFQNFSQNQQATSESKWMIASPETIAGFSAVCYLTATRISDYFQGKVPFGLIDTSVGGTAAQLWLPPRYASSCANVREFEDWGPPWTLSCWYNGMVSPWTQHDITAILWDQGENNIDSDPNLDLACLTSAVVTSWREAFHSPNAPFFFIQLPAYPRNNDTALGAGRDAQLVVADTLSNVGYAVTVDLGDAYIVCDNSNPPNCYPGSIHNRDKDLVANRLAPAVLVGVYGAADFPYLSPRYESATQTSDSTVTVSLTKSALTSSALPLHLAPPVFSSNSSWCPNDGGNQRRVFDQTCGWFEILYNDGLWRNATVEISPTGDSILLTTTGSQGLKAIATKNGYADWPVVSVYTKSGLPLVPWGPRNISQS